MTCPASTWSPGLTAMLVWWLYVVVSRAPPTTPCETTVRLPYAVFQPADSTVPARAAFTGVPHGTPKSVPVCSLRTPVIGCTRMPNGEVIGPTAGRARVFGWTG